MSSEIANEGVDDMQAESGASAGADGFAGCAIKSIKDVVQVFGGDPDAVIDHITPEHVSACVTSSNRDGG